MTFRADEAARIRYEEMETYFISQLGDGVQREHSRRVLQEIVDDLGSVVDAYPSWHPLVRNQNRGAHSHFPVTTPSDSCGYRGLDHTRFFTNGFITCPYGDGQEIIDSVNALPQDSFIAIISAERLDIKLYSSSANPILVKCEWEKSLGADGMIPLSVALPLILEKEIPSWRWSEVAETWETMRPYFLGRPYGSRSSLFVSQETGLAIKKIWNMLIYTGMYGSIMV